MKAWYCLPIFGILIFSLTGCSARKSPSELARQLEQSVVLINYKNRGGHGTGFFVPGNKDRCTVLTARHVVAASEELKLKTNDDEIWEVSNIQRFANHDLAVLTFTPDGSKCPYRALELGNSNTVRRAQRLYISGYYNSSGRLVNHFVSGEVTAIDSLPDGYGIAYQAVTTKGMSGSPVINLAGEVVAVHGRSDVEITRLAEIEGFPEPQLQSDEIIERGARIGTFKWGIPINLYLDNIPEEKLEARASLSAEDFYNQGNDLLFASEKYQEAIASYDQALEIKPDYAKAWHNRGFALDELGRSEEAIASYDKALEIKPDYATAWNHRGNSLADLGRHEEALDSYNKAIEINPNYTKAINNQEDILKYLNNIPKEKPEAIPSLSAEDFYNQGNDLLFASELDRYEKAIASYDKAIEINPDKDSAWYNRGIALRKLGRYEEAIASYDQAIEIKPDYAVAWVGRGNALDELGRYEDAIASFDKAIEIQPDDHKAWDNRGIALGNLGRHQEAIASFDKAIEIKPDYANAWYNRGISLRKLGRYEEVIASYDKAIEIQPDDHKAWNNRGFALENIGRYEEALDSYDKAIEINPNYTTAINNRKNMLKKLKP